MRITFANPPQSVKVKLAFFMPCPLFRASLHRFRLLLIAWGVLLAWPAGSKAAELEDRADYQAALKALAEGLPEVAAAKWERMLKGEKLASQDVSKVAGRLVDAEVRARMGDKVMEALTLYTVPEAMYWKGQALLLNGHLRDAERAFREYLSNANAPLANYAKLSMGQAIIGLGRENTGRKEFKELIDDRDPTVARMARIWSYESELVSFPERASLMLRKLTGPERVDPEVEFIRACAYLNSGDAQEAQSIFHWLLDQKVSLRLHEAALVRRAESFAALGHARTAEKQLIEYIHSPDEGVFYEAAFALLRKVADPDDDDAPARLLEWSTSPKLPARRALALYHYADWLSEAGRRKEAIPYIETFLKDFPGHPRESEALRLAMECHGAAGDDDRVLALATLWREKFSSSAEGTVDYLTGMIRFSRKEYTEAQKLFQRSAEAASNFLQQRRAIYNRAIAALLGGSLTEFESCRVQLSKSQSDEGNSEENSANANEEEAGDDPAADLMLERALHMASQRASSAETTLQQFLKTYPKNPRAVEAQIALAEFCLLSDPPRPKAAETALEGARNRKNVPDEWKERIDYTEMWLREARSDYVGAAEQGLVFIKDWPKSRRRDEVRMKVAQSYYRVEEYTKALVQFDQLVEDSPESPYVEAARFFAGKAALALMNEGGLDKAIEHWSEVAERGGPLAVEARRQQALVKRRQGKTGDALAVIDALLTGTPAPQDDVRLSLLIEKGELLLVSAKTDPSRIEQAMAAFRTVQQDSHATRVWKNRAGVLLAQCYHTAGRIDETLVACNDVVDSTLAVNVTQLTPSDYLWLYRAGFFELDLLESKGNWNGAAHLADRLAQSGGERSEEAKNRATEIRLEHFLWDK